MTIVTPATIGTELHRLHESMLGTDEQFSTVASNNVIIIASAQTPAPRLQAVVSAFTQAHPSRFFILQSVDGESDLSITVSAMCHAVGAHEKVCSEIVSMAVPDSSLQRLPSIVRANLLSGRYTELFVVDDIAASRLFPPLAQTCDNVYLDSMNLTRGLEAVQLISERVQHVVDLAWMRLSIWRDALRHAFSAPALSNRTNEISEVRLKYRAAGRGGIPSSVLLLAGWFISRLGAEILSVVQGQIHCRTANGSILPIALEEASVGKAGGLHEVFVGFDGQSDVSLRIKLGADGIFETIANVDPPLHTQRKIEIESEDALLSRHFLVGESTSNFPASLQCALLVFERLARR